MNTEWSTSDGESGEDRLNLLEGFAPIVGQRIRQSRIDKGMSQKDLVGERFSKSYISSIERGKITPSLKALEYIASRLEVSVAYLLTGATSMQSQRIDNGEDEQEAASRWDLLLLEAKILRQQGKRQQAFELLSQRVRVRQLGIDQLKQYHYQLALLAVELHELDNAGREIETARNLAAKTSDFDLLARLNELEGQVLAQQSKQIQAVEQFRQALQAVEAEQVEDFQFRLDIYSKLGLMHRQLSNNQEASQMYEEALDLAGEVNSPQKLADLYWNISNGYRENGNLSQARTYASKSLALYESLNDLRLLAQLRLGFGQIMLQSKQFKQAEEQFLTGLKLAEEQQDPVGLTQANSYLSELYREQNQLELALQHSDAALETYKATDAATQMQTLSNRGYLMSKLGQQAEAVESFEKAVALIEQNNLTDNPSKVYYGYAGALRSVGETTRAATMYERAYRQLGRGY